MDGMGGSGNFLQRCTMAPVTRATIMKTIKDCSRDVSCMLHSQYHTDLQIMHGYLISQPIRAITRRLLAVAALCVPLGSMAADAPDLEAKQLAALRMVEAMALTAGDREQALEVVDSAYQQALRDFPESVEILNGYGSWLWEVERRDEAWVVFSRAEKLDPTNAATAALQANAYLFLGDVGNGVRKLKLAVESAPDEPLHHFNYAVAVFLFRHEIHEIIGGGEEKAFDLAVKHHRIASELDPANLRYATGYAEAFYTIEPPRWEEAVKAWMHVREVSLDPHFATTHIARVHLRNGQPEKALAELQTIPDGKFSSLKGRLREMAGEQLDKTNEKRGVLAD